MNAATIARNLGEKHRRKGVRLVPKTQALALIKAALSTQGSPIGERRLQPGERRGLWNAYFDGYHAIDNAICTECGRSADYVHTSECSIARAQDAEEKGHSIDAGACIHCGCDLDNLDLAEHCTRAHRALSF